MLDHFGIPSGRIPQKFMKIALDLAEIMRIRFLDWSDGEEGKGRGVVDSNFVMVKWLQG